MNGERKLQPLSEIRPEETDWLWEDRVVCKTLNAVLGNSTEGKSAIANDLIGRITSGRPMPGGTEAIDPAGVVLLAAEDVLAATVRRNLEAAGADLDRVYVHNKASFGRNPLLLPEDQPLIEEAAAKVGAKLVVIDPFSAFLSGSTNSERNVRRALGLLAAFAERAGAAVLLIGHLNKGGSPNPLYRGSGSIAIIAAVRSGLLAGRDPSSEDPYRHVLVSAKGNLSSASGLAYRTVKRGNSIVVEWLGPSSYTAEDLIGPVRQDARALQEAVDVLRAVLAEGPVWSAEVIKLAAQAGVSKRTLDRARALLGVIPLKRGSGRGSKWTWELPAREDQSSTLRDHDVDDRTQLALRRGLSPTGRRVVGGAWLRPGTGRHPGDDGLNGRAGG